MAGPNVTATAPRRRGIDFKRLIGSGDRIALFALPFAIVGFAVQAMDPTLLAVDGSSGPTRAIAILGLAVGALAWAWSVGLILSRVPREELITTGPYAIVAAFFLVSVVISELMSNSGTVALLGPIAVASAREMGVNPMSLLAAVALGSSAAFAMPIGYQTSLMIYGPGGYRFKDFIRMGIALDLILAVLALWFIPRVWPLYPPPAAP